MLESRREYPESTFQNFEVELNRDFTVPELSLDFVAILDAVIHLECFPLRLKWLCLLPGQLSQ